MKTASHTRPTSVAFHTTKLDFRPCCPNVLNMADPTNRTREDMLADLEASDAEAMASDLVPGETVLAAIQAAIDRLEARLGSA